MNTKHISLIVASLALAVGALSGCGKTDEAAAAKKPADAASKPAAAASSGNVVVAPISKVASAPGIDPMNAKTLPPMPVSARASAPLPSADRASDSASSAAPKAK